MRTVVRWGAALAAALLLSGCTGGQDGAPLQPDATSSAAGSPSHSTPVPSSEPVMEIYDVPPGSGPHDVAPAADGGVWYTAQTSGELGYLDPATGETRHIPLGPGSRPHGVIVGPDRAPWITDGGLNAIVRVDPDTDRVQVHPLPADRPDANLNTAAFDGAGQLWFTGQNGIYGRLDPAGGELVVYDAPRGPGPYGITATPDGEIYFVSLAGSYLAQVDLDTGQATVLEPPTPGQGARRVCPTRPDSSGSASGTPARSPATTRAPATGGNGRCRAKGRNLTRSTSTNGTRSG